MKKCNMHMKKILILNINANINNNIHCIGLIMLDNNHLLSGDTGNSGCSEFPCVDIISSLFGPYIFCLSLGLLACPLLHMGLTEQNYFHA